MKVTFTRFEGQLQNGRWCEILLDGEGVGTIEAEYRDVGSPGAYAHRYVVAGYIVTLFDVENGDRSFEAADARAALKAAKDFARSSLKERRP